jgi:CDP-diacylglycerol--serine O-phosphatidyltransferase
MIRRQIPNLITTLNLLCGCVAVICILNGWFGWAFLCFVVGVLADFADGLVARVLGVSGEMGKQLDSLADMVSFGVVPGVALYKLLADYWYGTPSEAFPWLALPGFLFTAFAAYRLGKFNIDERQSEEFRGLATPGATIFVMGLLMSYHTGFLGMEAFLNHPALFYAVSLLLGLLMVSDQPMFSCKVKGYGWRGKELRYVLLLAAVIMLVAFSYAGLSMSVALYVLFSFVGGKR